MSPGLEIRRSLQPELFRHHEDLEVGVLWALCLLALYMPLASTRAVEALGNGSEMALLRPDGLRGKQ